ncbi:MAG: BamA/TamA family outer membrane protein [Deltaproteobacteria bacterium]|nr:BamA/TamA family outer membrane protein [Deltaproteobacteria bacterium]
MPHPVPPRCLLIAGLLCLGAKASAEPPRIEGRSLDRHQAIIAALGLARGLSPADEPRVQRLLDELGYHSTIRRETGDGQATIVLRPFQTIRRILIKGNNWPLLPLFEEEIERRLRFRTGQRLPYAGGVLFAEDGGQLRSGSTRYRVWVPDGVSQLRIELRSGQGLTAKSGSASCQITRAKTSCSIDKPQGSLLIEGSASEPSKLSFKVNASSTHLATAIGLQEARMRRFLAKEGFFAGSLQIRLTSADDAGRVDMSVHLNKGRSFKIGQVRAIYRSSPGGADYRLVDPPIGEQELWRLFEDEFGIFSSRLLLYRRPFNTGRFKNAVQQLRQRFHSLGYPGVRVREGFFVDPCRPADRAVRIRLHIDPRRKIEIKYSGNTSIKSSDLDQALTIYESAAYDDYELANSATQLRRLYQSRGFQQARVRFVRRKLPKQRGDRITFIIEEGPRFRIQQVIFRGNKHIDASRLQKEIKTRRFPWLGYVGLGEGGYLTDRQLAQDVERIVQLYRSEGFPGVKVRAHVAPHRALLGRAGAMAAALAAERESDKGRSYVQFIIEEGEQVTVGRVSVEALSNTAPLSIEPGKTPNEAELGSEEPGSEELGDGVPDDGKQPAAGTSAQNDRPAEVADRPHRSSQRQQPLALAQATALPRSEIDNALAEVDLTSGKPFTPQRLERAKKALVALYADRGYPYAEVRALEEEVPTGAGSAQRRVDVRFTVEERQAVVFGPVFIRGNFKTREHVIRSALAFVPGQPFQLQKLRQSEETLRRLQIFSNVRIQLLDAPQRPQSLPVLVRVEERHDDHGTVEFAVGGSTDNPLFAALAYTNANTLGFGTNLELRGELGLEIQALSGRHIDRRLFGTDLTLDLSGFVRRQLTERLGAVFTFGGIIAVSRELFRNLQGSLRYEVRRVRRKEDLHRPTGFRDETAQETVLTDIAGIGPALVYDKRDHPLAPRKGFRLAGSALLASRVFGGSDDFIKFSTNGQAFVPLPFGVTLAMGMRYDHGIPLGSRVLLPKEERLFAGGDTTIRGFEEDRAFAERVSAELAGTPGVTILRVVPQGGNIRLLLNAELQFPLWKQSPLLGRDIYGALFIDNGVVTNSLRAMRASDFRHGAGVALRVALGVGFLSFEYAVPLDPQLGDPKTGRFHFNFGFIL